MCEKYGISFRMFEYRIFNGWNLEDALTTPSARESTRCYDHLGNEYSSQRKMCEQYGISLPAFEYRISNGWDLEDALTTSSARENTKCYDHLGSEYESMSAMCAAYGIGLTTYRQRINLGWDVEKALTYKALSRKKQCKDGEGNVVESETEMCDFHNIDRKLYVRRKSLGWSTEEALLPERKDTGKSCVDHLGNKYASYADLCRKYGLDWNTYKGRRDRGWTIEEILTKDVGHKCIDFKGVEYASMKEMCKAYKISTPMFQKRIQNYGWTLEEALTIPKNSSIGERRISKYLDYRHIEYFHDITIKRLFTELNLMNLYQTYLDCVVESLRMNNTVFDKKRIASMRFDFSLIHQNNIFAFIEYDGEQHFSWIDTFFDTLNQFLSRHSADEIKTKFTESGMIPLLRIRFDQIDYIPEMIDHLLNNPAYYISEHNTFLSEEEYWKPFNTTVETLVTI